MKKKLFNQKVVDLFKRYKFGIERTSIHEVLKNSKIDFS